MNTKHWTPPDNPDPSEILSSAEEDTRDGFHERALEKFVWFHNNAKRLEPSLSAVRLSFALGYWLDLAAVYPPALVAFTRVRDETEAAFRADTSNFELFHDLAWMNGYLGEGIRTADLFEHAAQMDHANAQRLYHVAERYLIAAGRFHQCNPFLDPDERLKLQALSYRASKEYEDSFPPREFQVPKLARTFYIRSVATLVGLLALNGRIDVARAAYDTALDVIDDDEFRSIMDAAMSGHLPEA